MSGIRIVGNRLKGLKNKNLPYYYYYSIPWNYFCHINIFKRRSELSQYKENSGR